MTAASGPQQPDEVLDRLVERLRDLTYRGRNMTGPEALTYAKFLLPVIEELFLAAPSAQPVSLSQQRRHAVQDGEGDKLPACICGHPTARHAGVDRPLILLHCFDCIACARYTPAQPVRDTGEGRRPASSPRARARELIEQQHDGSKYRSRWVGPGGHVAYGDGVQTVAQADAETAAPRPGMRRAGVQFWMTGTGWVTNKIRGDHL